MYTSSLILSWNFIETEFRTEKGFVCIYQSNVSISHFCLTGIIMNDIVFKSKKY